jgi:L-threonylcarbamoyladenylate synthase
MSGAPASARSAVTARLKAADAAHAAALLTSGSVGAIPTETVYGLAARVDDLAAVARIFEAKGRPVFDPLIVHVRDITHADTLGDLDAAPWIRPLLAVFWPGPLTVVVPARPGAVDGLVTGGLPTVALRSPAHPLARAILEQSGLALAAPSANRFGHVSPTTAAHVLADLDGRIDFVLDGGSCERGLESTIIGIGDDGAPTLLRAGALDRAVIADVVGQPVEQGVRVLERPLAPGQLARHYATRHPMRLWESYPARVPAPLDDERVLLAVVGCPAGATGIAMKNWPRFAQVELLAAAGDWHEAAAGLYAFLRQLDEADVDRLEVVLAPDEADLREAIADRLRRAAAPEPHPQSSDGSADHGG